MPSWSCNGPQDLFYGENGWGHWLRGCKVGGTHCLLRAAKLDAAPMGPSPAPELRGWLQPVASDARCRAKGLGMGARTAGSEAKQNSPRLFSVEKTWKPPKQYGPLVKRLRHRPFTAVTRVRLPHGSPDARSLLADVGVAESPRRTTRPAENCWSPDASVPALPGVSGASYLRILVAGKAGCDNLSGKRANMLPVAQ